MGERVHRSVMNIKVGIVFYVLSLFLAFFSRKIFLDCLGAEFMGLTDMLGNIMKFLSVAELGIGTSIVFFLYKPLQEDDHAKINDIVSMLAYLYRCIGFIIGGIGLLVSLFFPWWFGHLGTGLFLVYFAFYSFLASSMTGYIFNYRQLLLSANQKQYVVHSYFQTIALLQSLTQIILAYYFKNLYLWVVVGLVYTVIGCILFNHRINREYPWLKIDLQAGRRNLKQYPEVLKKTRQIFIQRINDFVLNHCDSIFIGWFVSVTQVAFFSNYMVLIYKLIFLVNILSDGLRAGVGNLLAEGNERNIMKVFWELATVRFFILGGVIFSLIIGIQSFIACWLGSEYQFSHVIVFLLILHLFFYLQDAAVLIFINGAGLYQDVWATWASFFITLCVTLVLGPFYGIAGILIGKMSSLLVINVFWKPYFLFTQGFHKSVWVFWRGMAPLYIIFAVFACIAVLIKKHVIDVYADSFLSLIVYGALTFLPLMALYFLTLFVGTKGMKYFVARKPVVYQILSKLTFQSNL